MALHESTFEYLQPTSEQINQMSRIRAASKEHARILEIELPDGPDKTYILRAHRQNAMWANVSVTRESDGSPRWVPPA
jgi:hypothetical protein